MNANPSVQARAKRAALLMTGLSLCAGCMGGSGSFEVDVPDMSFMCHFGTPQDATFDGSMRPISGELRSTGQGNTVYAGEIQFQTASGGRVPGEISAYSTAYAADTVIYAFSYLPPEGLEGAQELRWRVNLQGCDASRWAKLTVNLQPPAAEPPAAFGAVSDFASVAPGGTTVVDVLANDSAADGATVAVVSAATGFTASVGPDRHLRVTATSATGPGRIRYRITSDASETSEADLVVHVTDRVARSALYLAEELEVGRQELFQVDLATPGDSRLISLGGDTYGWRLRPDGAEVAYTRYDPRIGTNRIEFAALPSGTHRASLGEGALVIDYAPQGDQIAYAAVDPNGTISLFLARPGEPGSVVEVGPVTPTIQPPRTPQVAAAGFAFTPDGQSLIYASNKTSLGGFELFEAKVASPATAVRLHPPFEPGRGIDAPWEAPFTISPDGRWVAYIADVRVDEVDELHVVDRWNPGRAPLVVNGALSPGGEVRSMAFAPDGIAYVADQDQPGNRGLYYVSLVGGTPGTPVRVDEASAFGGVAAFKVLPDGTGAVYAALQDRSSAADLYLVGFGLPGVTRRLTPPGDDGFGASAQFAISPNGAAVVYRREGMYPAAAEMRFVEIAQPGVARRLHTPYPPNMGGGVETPVFAPDGHHVLFLGWATGQLPYQLYLADLNSQGEATRLNGDLVQDGFVLPLTYQTNFGFVENSR